MTSTHDRPIFAELDAHNLCLCVGGMDQKEVRKSSLAAATYRIWRARSQCRSVATRKAEAVLANTMIAHPRKYLHPRLLAGPIIVLRVGKAPEIRLEIRDW